MIWALGWRSHSTLEAQCVYCTQPNKETDLVHLDRNGLCRGAVSGYKHGWQVESYSEHFLYRLSTLAVGPKEGFTIPLSLIQGRFATPMGLRHQGPRCGCVHVSNTHSLRTSLTGCTFIFFKSILETGTPHCKCTSGDRGSQLPKCWP